MVWILLSKSHFPCYSMINRHYQFLSILLRKTSYFLHFLIFLSHNLIPNSLKSNLGSNYTVIYVFKANLLANLLNLKKETFLRQNLPFPQNFLRQNLLLPENFLVFLSITVLQIRFLLSLISLKFLLFNHFSRNFLVLIQELSHFLLLLWQISLNFFFISCFSMFFLEIPDYFPNFSRKSFPFYTEKLLILRRHIFLPSSSMS